MVSTLDNRYFIEEALIFHRSIFRWEMQWFSEVISAPYYSTNRDFKQIATAGAAPAAGSKFPPK